MVPVSPPRAGHSHVDKLQPQQVSIAPEVAALIRKMGVEKTQKFVEFISAVTGDSSESTQKLIKSLGRTKAGWATAENLAKSYREASGGNHLSSAAYLAEAVGTGWSALPEATRGRMAAKVVRSVAGTKLAPLAEVMARMDSGAGMQAVSALARGQGGDFVSAMKDVVKSLAEHPGLAKRVAPKLVSAMANLLPERAGKEFLEKAGARKVPVLGTVAVAIMDAAGIAKKPTDWKSWAGLGSTIAGLFAGVGTAASVLIDLSILAGEVVDIVRDLPNSMKARNPATS